MNLETIQFKNNRLIIIDQTLLPFQEKFLNLQTLEEVIEAIKSLKVRGAPAIGIVAAYGLVVHAINLKKQNLLTFQSLKIAANQLKQARPTAVNLSWAVERLLNAIKDLNTPEKVITRLKKEAIDIHQEDKSTCDKIGTFGSSLIKPEANILTHCNTGFLATGGIGTALGVVYKAFQQNKKVHVFVDETRPVGQGARLTYWELKRVQIPATLITDNMAGFLMQQGKIDIVITGADRIAANGDTANKIGTYSLAVMARFHKIPFYIAAPLSTFDLSLPNGNQIPIEERSSQEVLQCWHLEKEKYYHVYNPAFDITPAHLISGIITELGIINKPFNKNIRKLLNQLN